MAPKVKNVEESSTAKNCGTVSLLSAVNKVTEKLVNNRLVDDFEKCVLVFLFSVDFRSSGSTADLLAVVPDKIARLLIGRCGATRILALEHPNNIQGFFRMWHVGSPYKGKSWNFRSAIW